MRGPEVVSFRPGAILPPPRPRRQLVFLVHGYAVSEKSACRSYQKFQQELRFAARHIDEEVVWVHWPGDVGLPIVNWGGYPWKVDTAAEVGDRFAEVLRSQPGLGENPCKIVLLGHSLGCRVILSALARKKPGDAPPPAVAMVLLMAAAVPVEEVTHNGALATCREHLGRSVVLHSTHDWVLRMPFWAGQLFGRRQVLPEAIGTRGTPRWAWTRTRQMPYFGHNDYWTSPWTARAVARELGNVLSSPEPARPEPPERAVPARPAAMPRPGLAARAAGTVRRLLGR